MALTTRFVVLGVLAAAVLGAGLLYVYNLSTGNLNPMQDSTRMITVGPARVAVEVADTDQLRVDGLSGRTGLAEGAGMLFVFGYDEAWGIWMKDMRFALDIIWADAEGKIVHIEESAQPDSYPTIFRPGTPARYVLEVPAGFVEREGIEVGQQIVL